MIRDDENDSSIEFDFFKLRSKKRNPSAQKKPPLVKKPTPQEFEIVAKKRKRTIGNAYQNTHTGARADLGGIVCRSSWESDVLRVLQLWDIEFEFEPRVFSFPMDNRGKMGGYLPDIYLPKTDEYIEVKGMLDPRGRNKLRKFKKHYPEEFKKLTVVISKGNKTNKIFFNKLGVKQILFMEHLTKLFADKIIMWESRKK